MQFSVEVATSTWRLAKAKKNGKKNEEKLENLWRNLLSIVLDNLVINGGNQLEMF